MTESSMPRLTAQQIDQLLKLLPPSSSHSTSLVSHTEDTDEEIDYSFAGMAVCLHAKHETVNWVIDTGAIDHMTSLASCLSKIKGNSGPNGGNCCIKLPKSGTCCTNGRCVTKQ